MVSDSHLLIAPALPGLTVAVLGRHFGARCSARPVCQKNSIFLGLGHALAFLAVGAFFGATKPILEMCCFHVPFQLDNIETDAPVMGAYDGRLAAGSPAKRANVPDD